MKIGIIRFQSLSGGYLMDITKHKWSDDEIINAYSEGDSLLLILPSHNDGIVKLNESDSIVISRHFGLVDVYAMREFAQWAEDRRQDFPKCTEALEAFIFMKTNMGKNNG